MGGPVVILVGFVLGVVAQLVSTFLHGSWQGVAERLATGLIASSFLAALVFSIELVRLKRSPVITWEAARRPNVRSSRGSGRTVNPGRG